MSKLLAGLRILLLEDEFLIAMDVEQECHDHGAEDVFTVRSLAELGADTMTLPAIDAAIIDIMLGGESTLDFAARLQDASVPFVFASGYADSNEFRQRFPGVAVISKPYSCTDLVAALARACGRAPASGSV